jgi:hypothetical protein
MFISLYKLQKLLSVGGEVQLPLRSRTQGLQQDDSEVDQLSRFLVLTLEAMGFLLPVQALSQIPCLNP